MSDLSRLFLTVYKVEIRVQGGDQEIVALAHTLRVPREQMWTPGPDTEYVFSRLGSLRWVADDPRTHGWLTSRSLMGWQRGRIDNNDLIRGNVDVVPLAAYPRNADGTLKEQRSIESLAMMFANFAPSKVYRMPVPTKVAHAEAFLAQLESRWPSQG